MEQETSIEKTEMPTELSLAIARINELHAQAEELAQKAKEVASKTIEIAIECGKLLIEQKAKVGHGNWEKWCRDNLIFDIRTAQRYMGLFRKTREIENSTNSETLNDSSVSPKTTQNQNVSFLEIAKPKNIRQAYIATGILPETPKPDPEDKIEPLVVHVRHIDFIVKWYRDTVENKPAKDWKFIEREALINDLTPLMEIYNELIELQENCKQ